MPRPQKSNRSCSIFSLSKTEIPEKAFFFQRRVLFIYDHCKSWDITFFRGRYNKKSAVSEKTCSSTLSFSLIFCALPDQKNTRVVFWEGREIRQSSFYSLLFHVYNYSQSPMSNASFIKTFLESLLEKKKKRKNEQQNPQLGEEGSSLFYSNNF